MIRGAAGRTARLRRRLRFAGLSGHRYALLVFLHSTLGHGGRRRALAGVPRRHLVGRSRRRALAGVPRRRLVGRSRRRRARAVRERTWRALARPLRERAVASVGLERAGSRELPMRTLLEGVEVERFFLFYI